MNGNQSNVWCRVAFSLIMAALLVFLAHLALPARATTEFDGEDQNFFRPEFLAGAEVFTVTGTVTKEETGATVPNVEVFAFSGAAQGKTFTNNEGQYTLTLSAGLYDFVFHPPLTSGLASQARRWIRETQTLNVTLPPGHIISGTVYSDITKSNPVSNVNIFASNRDTFVGIGATPTLSDGTYSLALETGRWELTFTPPHFLSLGPTRTAVISLTHNITQDAILPSGFTVYGQVTAEGKGVPNVDIFAQEFGQDGGGFGITATDANGHYTGTLKAGDYDILYFAPPFKGLGSTVTTNISGTMDVEANVSLPSGHTVSGKITCDTGLANVFVLALPEPPVSAGRFSGWGRFTGADGFYALALQESVYTFSIEPPKDSGFPQRIIPTVAVTQDLTLNVDYCPIFLPIIFKAPDLNLVDDFDDGQDPNALGGYSSIGWPVPCPQTISGTYDSLNAYSDPYGYRLSYNVTPICYGLWQTDLRDYDYSHFSTLTFWIKGGVGGEQPRVYLQDNDDCQITTCRHFVKVGPYLPVGQVTTEWQQAKIPLSIFAANGVNLTKLRFLQIVFEWDNLNGVIYVDDIRFE